MFIRFVVSNLHHVFFIASVLLATAPSKKTLSWGIFLGLKKEVR